MKMMLFVELHGLYGMQKTSLARSQAAHGFGRPEFFVGNVELSCGWDMWQEQARGRARYQHIVIAAKKPDRIAQQRELRGARAVRPPHILSPGLSLVQPGGKGERGGGGPAMHTAQHVQIFPTKKK